MKVSVSILAMVTVYWEVIFAKTCPTQLVQQCETIFNKSFRAADPCRSTRMLKVCLAPFTDSCSENEEYQRAEHLVERHSFLHCRCPEEMIETFMTAFLDSDICSNLGVFEEFARFYDVPACSNNKNYIVVKYMRNVLPGICAAQNVALQLT